MATAASAGALLAALELVACGAFSSSEDDTGLATQPGGTVIELPDGGRYVLPVDSVDGATDAAVTSPTACADSLDSGLPPGWVGAGGSPTSVDCGVVTFATDGPSSFMELTSKQAPSSEYYEAILELDVKVLEPGKDDEKIAVVWLGSFAPVTQDYVKRAYLQTDSHGTKIFAPGVTATPRAALNPDWNHVRIAMRDVKPASPLDAVPNYEFDVTVNGVFLRKETSVGSVGSDLRFKAGVLYGVQQRTSFAFKSVTVTVRPY